MELRVLRYFLAVAREGNITNAAAGLHITQPTLSRQLHQLEEELGQPLFVRHSHSITLTPEGMLLRQRAEEILALVQKTTDDLAPSNEVLTGSVHIGAGETDAVHLLTQAAHQLQQVHPQVQCHIYSGDSSDVLAQLDHGLIDFGLIFDPITHDKYHAIKLAYEDTWGVLMRKDSPLAAKACIRPEDICHEPLIFSRQSRATSVLKDWFGVYADQLHVTGTYSLVFNGSLMVQDGIGYALTLDKIINVSGDSPLCFRPLDPPLTAGMHIVWKKYQRFSKPAEKYLAILLEHTAQNTDVTATH